MRGQAVKPPSSRVIYGLSIAGGIAILSLIAYAIWTVSSGPLIQFSPSPPTLLDRISLWGLVGGCLFVTGFLLWAVEGGRRKNRR